jgi:hypothetical protein
MRRQRHMAPPRQPFNRAVAFILPSASPGQTAKHAKETILNQAFAPFALFAVPWPTKGVIEDGGIVVTS